MFRKTFCFKIALCQQLRFIHPFHINCRHGDKATEMKLIEFSSYVEAAEKMAIHNPLGYKRMAFVSSEDPQVIEDTIHLQMLDNGAPRDLLGNKASSKPQTTATGIGNGCTSFYKIPSSGCSPNAIHTN